MTIALTVAHILISILLISAVLIQSKGQGLAAAFGGSGEVYHTRRGAERVVFIGTIVLTILFAVTSLLNVVLPS